LYDRLPNMSSKKKSNDTTQTLGDLYSEMKDLIDQRKALNKEITKKRKDIETILSGINKSESEEEEEEE
jgi:septal ring factor EnvC (AmiA/AmiB activator)